MMINVNYFCEKLFKLGTDFFTGVPDSLLKSFCAYITDNVNEDNHIIASNEGAAIGLACGYHLATGKIPLVYMQNSGIGNAVNPLLSLADYDVYQIPVILLVGWRGEPGFKDEPQHIKQGKVTCSMFDSMEVPYLIMADTLADLDNQIYAIYDHFSKRKSPYALIVKKDIFSEYKLKNNLLTDKILPLTREAAIEAILSLSNKNELFISTTGMASRELFELREKSGLPHSFDFLTVGSMGHSSVISLGIALQKPNRFITCLDGDGSLLMHTGSLATIGSKKPRNFRHIILNNGSHDSVGGQPTTGFQIDIPSIAKAFGYEKTYSACNLDQLQSAIHDIDKENRFGPVLLEVRICKGARKDLGRPHLTPVENKNSFMSSLLS